MRDQAHKLRKLINKETVEDDLHEFKVYSIVSGKGGVGKTNFTVNFGIRLQQLGKKVLILDADIGMSNVNILLGIGVPYNLFDMIYGGMALGDIIVKGPGGVDIISGGAELLNLENLNDERQKEILKGLSDLGRYDILLIDNGAGMSKQSLLFTILADEMILITTPEPTSITDAYRVLKAISLSKLKNKVKVVINQINDKNNGLDTYNKLLTTSRQFLDLDLESLGFIFNDIRVNKAIMEQSPFVLSYPNSLASSNINQICSNILDDGNYALNLSSMKQFSNRILKIFG